MCPRWGQSYRVFLVSRNADRHEFGTQIAIARNADVRAGADFVAAALSATSAAYQRRLRLRAVVFGVSLGGHVASVGLE